MLVTSTISWTTYPKRLREKHTSYFGQYHIQFVNIIGQPIEYPTPRLPIEKGLRGTQNSTKQLAKEFLCTMQTANIDDQYADYIANYCKLAEQKIRDITGDGNTL